MVRKKPGKTGKMGIFSKSQGKPGKVRQNRKKESKVREKSEKFFDSHSFFLFG